MSPHINLQDIMSESRGKGKQEQGTGCERRLVTRGSLDRRKRMKGKEGTGLAGWRMPRVSSLRPRLLLNHRFRFLVKA